jgi:regulator of ribonuclease activity A
MFRDFGAPEVFHGQMAVLKVFEDNSLMRTLLEEPGAGRVLAVDGGGSMRCALVGGNPAQLAMKNGWRGLIVYGCIRDSTEIRDVAIGVKALGTTQRKSEKGLHTGRCTRAVNFAGVTFTPGQWLYADLDGILVSAIRLLDLP